MSPLTQGPMGRLTSGLRLVSRNPKHFRNGRWFLLAQGVLLIALGTAGFVSAATQRPSHRCPSAGIRVDPLAQHAPMRARGVSRLRRSPAPRSDPP